MSWGFYCEWTFAWFGRGVIIVSGVFSSTSDVFSKIVTRICRQVLGGVWWGIVSECW